MWNTGLTSVCLKNSVMIPAASKSFRGLWNQVSWKSVARSCWAYAVRRAVLRCSHGAWLEVRLEVQWAGGWEPGKVVGRPGETLLVFALPTL